MKSEKKNNEANFNEAVITFEVDCDVIEKVRSGEITHIGTDINEKNQNLILQNFDGNLILITDELPNTFHACYLYNDGIFPYAIKDTLNYLLLTAGENTCLTRIVGVQTKPGTRFRFQGSGEPSVEDTNGDSCIWEMAFEIVPVPEEPRTYLMRWNPSISSFTEKDYEECLANMQNGVFIINWSIREWEEARRGDIFYMMRVGDEKAGIVFNGQFLSDPYPSDDWAGTTKRRMYVDMACMNPSEDGTKPRITLEKLQNAIPDLEWANGSSGVKLSEKNATKLADLFEES